ncbi:hypothetical protein NDU88_007170 [Pleurodeles waltl]|uniref:Uncharacterized protein n=1 Tax=Pleurodeles waltl TaxID=8319 RepID=A0AAV7UN41_PLEWA|nr:hypothetical protein NDU88_007170 [Pleurodeles waltl]
MQSCAAEFDMNGTGGVSGDPLTCHVSCGLQGSFWVRLVHGSAALLKPHRSAQVTIGGGCMSRGALPGVTSALRLKAGVGAAELFPARHQGWSLRQQGRGWRRRRTAAAEARRRRSRRSRALKAVG